MVLTRPVIERLLREKRLVVRSLGRGAIGPASIDLALGDELRVFTASRVPIRLREGADYRKFTRKIGIGRGYLVQPGELVLGITREHIELPDDVCGWLQSRSRYARVGLMSHITAPFIAPGMKGRQVLEIYNSSPHPILLTRGVRICHLILSRCEGSAKYAGVFRGQRL